MFPALGLHAISEFSVLRILDSLVEGSLLAVFAALLVKVSPARSARARFAIWFSALSALAVLPFLNFGSDHTNISVAMGHPLVTVRNSWAVYLFAAWAGIALVQLVGLARALWQLHKLRTHCTLLDVGPLDPVLQETIQSRGIKRQILTCTSEQVRVPTAIGLLKPAIVIPRWVMEELSPAELNHIFLHELAHLRRWDDWTNLLQQIVKALFFFHPAVWWMETNVAMEREMACDEAVVAATKNARAYAESLAHLAEKSIVYRGLALAQAALGRVRQTSQRLVNILERNHSGQSAAWAPAVSLVAGFALVCAIISPRTSALIAFQNPTAAQTLAQTNAARHSRDEASTISGRSMMPRNVALKSTALKSTAFVPRVIPAKLDSARGPSQKFVRAKLNVRNNQSSHIRSGSIAPRAVSRKGSAAGMVHLAKITAASPLTAENSTSETVFIVLERNVSPSDDGSLYQIEMWRVTVLRNVVPPTSKVPTKI